MSAAEASGAGGTRLCRRRVALVAGLAAAVVFTALIILARYPLPRALIVAGGAGLGIWVILRWTFCTGAGAPVTADARHEAAGDAPGKTPDPPVPSRAEEAPRPPLPDRRTAPLAAPPQGRPAGRGIDAAMSRAVEPPRPLDSPVLAGPRGGRPDDLTRIRGIGPALARLLNEEGVWHFDQIAGWKARDIARINDRIPGFRGRITRDHWVRQARALAGASDREEDG